MGTWSLITLTNAKATGWTDGKKLTSQSWWCGSYSIRTGPDLFLSPSHLLSQWRVPLMGKQRQKSSKPLEKVR